MDLAGINGGVKKAGRYYCLFVIAQAMWLFAVFAFEPVRTGTGARIPKAYADINGSLKTTLEMFRSNHGRFPTTEEGWNVLINPPKDGLLTNSHGPYLDQPFAPEDPWGHPYVYRHPAIHSTNSFDLYSVGSDGVSKTGGNDSDDINNWSKPHGERSAAGEWLFQHTDELLLVVPLLFVIRVIAGITSRRVRAIALENRAVDWVWFAISILALMIALCVPRIVG